MHPSFKKSHVMRSLIFLFWLSGLLNISLHAQSTDSVGFQYPSQKVLVADSAMVVCAHPLAAEVGLAVLKKGGNAVDAAVAVGFALAVVYPQAGNIGGGGFMIYRGSNGEVSALDFREKAPAAAYETMYQDSLGRVLTNKSRFGIFACGVPGTVDGLWEAHQKYGSLPWGQLVTPAVDLAEKGYQISDDEAEALNAERINFFRQSNIVPAFVKMTGWSGGDWLIQTDLGKTLRRIASEGRGGFYDRATAALILHEMKQQNGLITADDLRNYKSVWREPIVFDWNGLQIISMPPPSSGGLLIQQMLGMTDLTNLAQQTFHSPEAVHIMTEVERRAFADRAKHMGDPDFWPVPSDTLGSKAYLTARMQDFNPQKASPSSTVEAGALKESEETTHFSIVDRSGNAVSITTTLNDSYGSRTVVGGAGFILNNEMDDFSSKPGAPNLYGAIGGKANAVAGNKRPLSSMTPTIVTREGKLSMVVGTPGGTTIPTSVFQVILNVYLFNLDLEQAVHNGRFHHQWLPDKIFVEENTFPEALTQALTQMGHTVEVRSAIGRVEAILIQEDGKLKGVADNRGADDVKGY
jgi:gamma-glutamyltranspeptidase/glutathione hydrolase